VASYGLKLTLALETAAVDRRSKSDRPHCHARTRWTLPLPLVSATPRRTPNRASSQLMTSQWENLETYYYGHHQYS